jgi:hypothetical protein
LSILDAVIQRPWAGGVENRILLHVQGNAQGFEIPLLAKEARSGTSGFVVSAASVKGQIKIKINVKGNGKESPFHTCLASLHANSRFLARLRRASE